MNLEKRLIFDPLTNDYRDIQTGQRHDHLPPKERWAYTAIKPFRVGQRAFLAGESLGEGNISQAYAAAYLCEFVAETEHEGPDPLEAGHIYARLRDGWVTAELIEDEDD